jgi:outer membrane protein TolC
MFALASYLNFDKNASIRLRLPGHPVKRALSVEEALLHARENNPKFADFRSRILEAEQQVDKTRKEALFDASLSLSIGFNQVANTLRDAYDNPMQQDVVAVSVSIPLVDWGVRKGKYNMARNTLNVTQISARQEEISLEEDLMMTVSDFNVQQQQIAARQEALDLAQMAYAETKQRFIIGKADVNSLTLSLNRQQEAERNYIRALRSYQLSYYKIRKLTLHDFDLNISLSRKFDYE